MRFLRRRVIGFPANVSYPITINDESTKSGRIQLYKNSKQFIYDVEIMVHGACI